MCVMPSNTNEIAQNHAYFPDREVNKDTIKSQTKREVSLVFTENSVVSEECLSLGMMSMQARRKENRP